MKVNNYSKTINPALEASIFYYSTWAMEVMSNCDFDELKEIGLICDKILNEHPCHLGIDVVKKRFDINTRISQITPVQVIALAGVCLDLMSGNQYQEKGGMIADSVQGGISFFGLLDDKRCEFCDSRALTLRDKKWLCFAHSEKLDKIWCINEGV